MLKFIRLFTVFIYFCLALFINPNEVLARDNLEHNIARQYYITQPKTETELTNKKEEYYVIFQSRNKSEITNTTNKNDNYGSIDSDNSNNKIEIANSFLYENTLYPVHITHYTSNNLKNAINIRAP